MVQTGLPWGRPKADHHKCTIFLSLPCLCERPAQLQHAEGSEPRQWGVNNLPKVAEQQRHYRDSNPRPSDRKSDALPLRYRATQILPVVVYL